MSYYIADLTTFSTLFEFDIGRKESRRTEVEWTGRALESGAQTKEHGITKEETYKVEGIVTAWPLKGVPRRDVQRVMQADDQLRKLAKAKQPVTLITGWWAATVTISSVSGSTDIGTGEALKISIDCTTITVAKPVYTTIPPSRLKSSVRKSNTAPPRGGAAAGKQKGPASAPKPKSWLKGILGRL